VVCLSLHGILQLLGIRAIIFCGIIFLALHATLFCLKLYYYYYYSLPSTILVEFVYLFIYLLGLFKQFWAVKLALFFLGGGGLPATYNNNTDFFVFSNMFPSSSQCVPQHVPNIITLLSHMLWPKLNFHIYNYFIYFDGSK
jgi:hypothetical protein